MLLAGFGFLFNLTYLALVTTAIILVEKTGPLFNTATLNQRDSIWTELGQFLDTFIKESVNWVLVTRLLYITAYIVLVYSMEKVVWGIQNLLEKSKPPRPHYQPINNDI